MEGIFTIRQTSSGRFLDGHEIEDQDFQLVTRPAQDNDTQRWILTPVGVVHKIRHKTSGRFLDAYGIEDKDFRLVTRFAQSVDSQRWIVMPVGDGSFTIQFHHPTAQQRSNGRFLNAYQGAPKDFGVITRPRRNSSTDRWLLDRI